MRNHVSCPDCGHVYREPEEMRVTRAEPKPPAVLGPEVAVDCPKCGAHYTWEEFWDVNHDKWDRTAEPDRVDEVPEEEQEQGA